MSSEERLFKTTSLDLAAYLLARGHKVLSTERQGKFIVFVFSPSAEDVAEEFSAGAPAPADLLLANYRSLRTLITEQQKGAKEICHSRTHLQ